MRSLTVLGLLIVCLACCQAYTYIMLNATNPDFPGECYDPKTKIHFKPGEIRQRPFLCEEMACGSDFSIDYYGCGIKLVAKKNCMDAGQDLNLPYPDCCKRYKCKIDGKVFHL
uniref:Putative conserved secreted protein n=1 Tax=Culex tarsalis TaxID=7177 RepID=A0A1Q3G4V3_CULTA